MVHAIIPALGMLRHEGCHKFKDRREDAHMAMLGQSVIYLKACFLYQ